MIDHHILILEIIMKTYWITGASSGIGEALAKTLFKQGHQIILSARNEAKLKELHDGMGSSPRVAVLPFDLRDVDHAANVALKAVSLFGHIDVVVLNAGLSQRSLVKDTELKVYRDLMEVNYFGNIALARALLPFFMNRNSGHFVVISSLVGKFGTPFRSGYSASKHALHGYFDSLRAEMMRDNLNVNVTIICPGFVSTNISFNALGSEGKNIGSYDDANANGLKPEEFAERAIEVINKNEFEAYIGGKETLGVHLKRFFPNFFAKKIARAKVR